MISGSETQPRGNGFPKKRSSVKLSCYFQYVDQDSAVPFTPTHILAILPIAAVRRLSLPFPALVIGSMIPDLPLFLPLGPGYVATHSIPGLITACLPLGLVWYLLFQFVMKRPLFALLPSGVQRRCVSTLLHSVEPTLSHLVRVSFALVVGASTHLFWDSFTHEGRWGTRVFLQLNAAVVTVGGQTVPGYKLLQYGSTVVGLPCLALLLAGWLYRQPSCALDESAVLSRVAKAGIYVVAVTVSAVATWLTWHRVGVTRYNQLGQSIKTSGLALLIVALTYCAAFLVLERRFGRSS